MWKLKRLQKLYSDVPYNAVSTRSSNQFLKDSDYEAFLERLAVQKGLVS